MNSHKLSFGVLLALAMGTIAQAGTPPPLTPIVFPNGDTMFNDFENEVKSTAACLVATGDRGPGLAACFCGINMGFEFCSDQEVTGAAAGFAWHPTFAGAIAAQLEINDLVYDQTSPIPGEDEKFTLDVRGTCDMTQGSLELALDPGWDRRSLSGILGAKAQYSAVYMFPYYKTEVAGTEIPIGDPVRLCGLGQIDAMAAGTIHRHSHDGNRRAASASANLAISNVGFTGGYEWGVGGLPASPTSIGVRYVVVAGVAAANLKINKKSFNAIGVLANASIHNASMKIEYHDVYIE